MTLPARLALAVAAAGAALAFAGAGLADPSASGKPTNHHAGDTARHGGTTSAIECPPGLDCEFIPAAYMQNSSDPGDYGNYDLATRPDDGLAIRYVVIHDTESSYASTIAEFQNSLSYVSAHYVIRSADGHVAQMVPTADVAWHAGNWWVNTHAVGIENEGYATELSQWFTPQLYSSLARLTKYQAARYGIPLDREHLIGHDQVPGPTQVYQAGMHWDPGPYFDWARFMRLVGSPITGPPDNGANAAVTIDPNFQTNRPAVTYCDPTCRTLPSQPTNFVYLHTAPSESSPLVADPLLSGTNLEPDGVGTTQANDWGDKAVTGQTFAVAGRSGNWTGIWYGGQVGWFYNPRGANAIAGNHGVLVTPKAGRGAIPVYGRAYPDSVGGTATLGYTIPQGQVYVAAGLYGADYYSATTYNDLDSYRVITGPERYYEISFNHRIAFLRASDVEVVR